MATVSMVVSQEALMLFPFVKNGVLSRGRVAELLNMNKFELIAIYQRFGMPFIDSPVEELDEDIANCERVMDRG